LSNWDDAVTTYIRALSLLALAYFCGGCAVTDQFSSRIYSSNINSQVALDQETLLNIVRASRYQSLTFVAITKTAGTQTADLKIGLPTFTFGPRQTAAQRQFSFANNAIDNSAQGSFESNPLISSLFQQGMLTPISPKILALLIGAHPREPTFLAALEGIRLTSAKDAWFFRNDPANNSYRGEPQSAQCHDLEIVQGRHGAYHNIAKDRLHPDYNTECNFSQFMYFLEFGLAVGMTADIDHSVSVAGSTKTDPSRTSNAVNTPGTPGRICFEPSLARPDLKIDSQVMSNKCGTKFSGEGLKFRFGDTDYEIELVLRSPIGVYAFLGKLLRDGTADQYRMQDEALGPMRHAKLVEIDPTTVECLLSASSVGGLLCDPGASGRNTLLMVDLLQQLRNLMISPADLNASFSVRLSD